MTNQMLAFNSSHIVYYLRIGPQDSAQQHFSTFVVQILAPSLQCNHILEFTQRAHPRKILALQCLYSQGHIQVLIPVGLADGEPVVHVLAVGAGVGELLEALEALERFLAGVQALVLRQVVLVLERLRAHLALVWPLTCK